MDTTLDGYFWKTECETKQYELETEKTYHDQTKARLARAVENLQKTHEKVFALQDKLEELTLKLERLK